MAIPPFSAYIYANGKKGLIGDWRIEIGDWRFECQEEKFMIVGVIPNKLISRWVTFINPSS
jgi:hypothetical protein